MQSTYSTTSATTLMMSSEPSSTTSNTLSLQLTKPLGLILEEDESTGRGVVVTQVNEGGSAFESPHKDSLINAKIMKVDGKEVGGLTFEQVMDAIVEGGSELSVEFALAGSASTASATEETTEVENEVFKIGTPISITVQQPDKADIVLEAKVGDNLRKTLLANKDIELYRGLKKKLGNCGGSGQCGFCAVELVDETEGKVWGERSEYEDNKIKGVFRDIFGYRDVIAPPPPHISQTLSPTPPYFWDIYRPTKLGCS